MKLMNWAAAALAAALALTCLSGPAYAQSQTGLDVKDAAAATKTLCTYTVSSNQISCQAKYVWNGSAWVLESADTSGRTIVNAPFSPTATNPTSTLALPGTTTAYSANQIVANSATGGSVVVPSFAIANTAGGARIPRLRLTTNDATSTGWGAASVQVDLWTAAPTFANGDRNTWNATNVTAGAAGHLGSYTCTFAPVVGDGAYAECAPQVGAYTLAKLASGTTVYWTEQTITATGVVGVSKTFTLTAELEN